MMKLIGADAALTGSMVICAAAFRSALCHLSSAVKLRLNTISTA